MKKAEVKKVNAPKVQQKVETKKVDTKKVEAKKVEVKAEVKTETKKVASPKVETKVEVKTEANKVETKAETKKPVEAKTETKTETPKAVTKTKAVSTITQIVVNGKPLSAGAQVREMFAKALEEKKIKAEQIAILTDTEKTKETLGIRYAFLKVATDKKEDRLVNGCPRYGKATVKVNGKAMWMTNDVYARNLPKFKAWIDALK